MKFKISSATWLFAIPLLFCTCVIGNNVSSKKGEQELKGWNIIKRIEGIDMPIEKGNIYTIIIQRGENSRGHPEFSHYFFKNGRYGLIRHKSSDKRSDQGYLMGSFKMYRGSEDKKASLDAAIVETIQDFEKSGEAYQIIKFPWEP